MRIRCLTGFVPAVAVALAGCSDNKKTEVPTQLVDLPGKDGAAPAEGGAPKGAGDKGKARVVPDKDG